MYWEPYNEEKHGRIGRVGRTRREFWEALFRAASEADVVVRGAQRQSLHYAARRYGYRLTVKGLADGDGFVVRASRL